MFAKHIFHVNDRFGTQQGRRDFEVLVLHFIEGQIVVFLSMMSMCSNRLMLLKVGKKS